MKYMIELIDTSPEKFVDIINPFLESPFSASGISEFRKFKDVISLEAALRTEIQKRIRESFKELDILPIMDNLCKGCLVSILNKLVLIFYVDLFGKRIPIRYVSHCEILDTVEEGNKVVFKLREFELHKDFLRVYALRTIGIIELIEIEYNGKIIFSSDEILNFTVREDEILIEKFKTKS